MQSLHAYWTYWLLHPPAITVGNETPSAPRSFTLYSKAALSRFSTPMTEWQEREKTTRKRRHLVEGVRADRGGVAELLLLVQRLDPANFVEFGKQWTSLQWVENLPHRQVRLVGNRWLEGCVERVVGTGARVDRLRLTQKRGKDRGNLTHIVYLGHAEILLRILRKKTGSHLANLWTRYHQQAKETLWFTFHKETTPNFIPLQLLKYKKQTRLVNSAEIMKTRVLLVWIRNTPRLKLLRRGSYYSSTSYW